MDKAPEEKEKRGGIGAWFREDPLVFILSIALLIAMGAATLYHFRYAQIDHSVMPGTVNIVLGDKIKMRLQIDEDLNATVKYRDLFVQGKLRLEGAEEDTVLYRLIETRDLDGYEIEDLILFIRVPRSGLQGDLCGPWMAYLSYEAWNSVCSDWFFIQEDGTALVGEGENMNAMTALRRDLLGRTRTYTWKRNSQVLYITEPEPPADSIDIEDYL